MEKENLRKKTIQSLYLLAEEKKNIEIQLYHHLFTSTLWKEATIIGVTISQNHEWNTKPIIEKAWEEGKTVTVPKCIPKTKQLTFYQLTNLQQLEKSYFDLLEPNPKKTKEIINKKIDLLIVPGVVFDRNGYRIGFGGGYYDRFLEKFTNTTVSLLHTTQLLEEIPKESHDIPVEYLITENGWIHKG
ncbi:5-formyltetrahydrofolate cyclo-ligase [Cerasibacillus terrae]|uniref:5-formyltetrahydrofolate cyclo-ligase n=1 Tax=Cerasibacillus terrae TaxID=2498845 RepID=A0A5C8P392_9BACI|nr:5-formyltetrahydrofolate cyclo-ligase [Cerasibacillus terrae]TXL67979.1 5-formyltetrahydrofolate cyclo-ligase [Cerasibacillus terrae]